ncbi:Interleukin-12 subunit beta [Merluccius polli]|uniref:Interleukin-12 subunit beta n=1 Tax=Merluccius polli TaxID=89951 RepID=A0AA47P045_MERPO|nr:Interleukin-12 subunit beta [Merluccius polli]
MRGLLALMVVCVASHRASCDENIYTLMDKVLVLRVPHNSSSMFYVPLVCGEAYKDQNVFWKRNDIRISLTGNKVNVGVEQMLGGKYSCHLSQDGRYLNHTLLLVQLNPDNKSILLNQLQDRNDKDNSAHILCSAHNYSGSFRCSWDPSRPKVTALLVEAARNSSQIDCELEAGGSGIQCEERSCVKPEEQHLIQLRIYIYSDFRLEMYSTHFNLRDIVTPQRVANLRRRGTEKETEFHWDDPESWEKPCSYYKLQFEVKLVQRKANCHSPPLTKWVGPAALVL